MIRLGKINGPTDKIKPLDQKIKYKLSVFLICFFIATFFWFIIKLSAEYTTIVYYPINFVNLPKDKIIHSTPDSVLKLLVKAKGFRIMNTESLRESSKLELDISNLQLFRSETYFYASLPSSRLVNQISAQIGQGITLISITPDTLSFVFESVRERSLPVMVNGSVQFEPGYFLYDSVRIQPSRVRVKGPEHIIDTLKAVRTANLLINDLVRNSEVDIHLELPPMISFADPDEKGMVKVIIPVESYDEVSYEYLVQYGMEEKKPAFRISPPSIKAVFKVAKKDVELFDPGKVIFYVEPSEFITDSITRLKVRYFNIPPTVKIGSVTPSEVVAEPLN